MSLPSSQRQALTRAISTDRLTGYRNAAAQRGCDVLELYVWDRDVAAAAIADIAILKVAMRNALSRQLEQLAGTPLTSVWTTAPLPRSIGPGRTCPRLSAVPGGSWRS